VQSKWKTLVPQRPLTYYFLDQNFNKQYATEDRFGKLFMYFAVLAIMISCLGLWALLLTAHYSVPVNWDQESTGCKRTGNSKYAIKRVFATGGHCSNNCLPDCMGWDA